MLQKPHTEKSKGHKVLFDIDRAVALIRQAVEPYPKAAMFELADQGYNKPFEQLVACIISIRTLDEVSIPTARRLFERARTPAEVAELSASEIDQLIHACTFHERKAGQIKAIAERVVKEFWGELPCEEPVLLTFAGVGVKCAHLTLGVACGDPYISVDIHVHRITNRWGYISASTPEKTMLGLEKKLPLKYWIEINRLLVPFGKHICTAQRPRCSACPLLEMCQQVGVTGQR
jgi:endonuclease-3